MGYGGRVPKIMQRMLGIVVLIIIQQISFDIIIINDTDLVYDV